MLLFSIFQQRVYVVGVSSVVVVANSNKSDNNSGSPVSLLLTSFPYFLALVIFGHHRMDDPFVSGWYTLARMFLCCGSHITKSNQLSSKSTRLKHFGYDHKQL